MVGKNIRLLRTYKDMTQMEMAARMGIENHELSRIETGRVLPPHDIVKEAARVLGIKYEDLAYGRWVVKLMTEAEEEAELEAGESTT